MLLRSGAETPDALILRIMKIAGEPGYVVLHAIRITVPTRHGDRVVLLHGFPLDRVYRLRPTGRGRKRKRGRADEVLLDRDDHDGPVRRAHRRLAQGSPL